MGHPFFLCAHGVLVAGVADHTVIDKWSGLVRLRLVVRVCEDKLLNDTEKTIRDSEVQKARHNLSDEFQHKSAEGLRMA